MAYRFTNARVLLPNAILLVVPGVEIVLEAVQQRLNAIALRHPPAGLIHHSDRGSQYCSDDYQRLLKRAGMIPSMGGKGNSDDNAMVETVFKTIKSELVWRTSFQTRRHAEIAIGRHIDGFYNPRRRHSAPNYRSPSPSRSTWRIRSKRLSAKAGQVHLSPQESLPVALCRQPSAISRPRETPSTNCSRGFGRSLHAGTAIEYSPRRPSRTMRIFSSAEYCLRVARRMSLTCFSADLCGPDFCLIFASRATMSQNPPLENPLNLSHET